MTARALYLLSFYGMASLLSAADLTHGPILGRPQSDSMRVWVRTS